MTVENIYLTSYSNIGPEKITHFVNYKCDVKGIDYTPVEYPRYIKNGLTIRGNITGICGCI
ncbi:MAG: hypothetical protein WDO16_06480 [Bacteroidota bacterium]